MTEPARRQVVRGEALQFLASHPAEAGTSVVTSLPDLSEIPGFELEVWRSWFVDAVRHILRWLPEDGVAIFYQSDVRHRGVWVDKGYLVLRAAEAEDAPLIWHRIVCRAPAGTPSLGRAAYSHLICVSKRARGAERSLAPDVLPEAGYMTWSRAMGVAACVAACEYLRRETSTRRIVDPFCGKGTVLAVANAMGLDALGVELSARRCRVARTLKVTLEPEASATAGPGA